MNRFDVNKCEELKSLDQSFDSEAEELSRLYEASNINFKVGPRNSCVKGWILKQFFRPLNTISLGKGMTFNFVYSAEFSWVLEEFDGIVHSIRDSKQTLANF